MGGYLPSASEEAVKKWKEGNMENKHINGICRDCALEMDGEWPEGRIATANNRICDVCKRQRDVCSPYAWNLWRDGTKMISDQGNWN